MPTTDRQLLYIHRTQGGGVEGVHIWGIAEAFYRSGIGVDVLSPGTLEHAPRNKMEAPSPKRTRASFSLISRYAPELIFELMEIAYNFVTWWRINKSGIDRYQAVFERYAIFAVVGACLARTKKIPLILEINYTAMSPLVRQRSMLLKPLARIVDRWVFSTASLLTPVSSNLKTELMQFYGVPEHKILVLPNAADPKQFLLNASQKTESTEQIIGFVGGFYPWHGLSLLLDAYSEIAPQFPKARIMLIGDGPEIDNVKNKIATLGLSDRVQFVGRVAHDELPLLMAQFYIGVMPDSNDYGSPMKIFEYMALGIPVVAPDYGPIRDVIEDGKQGLIFQRKNQHSLAASLKKILSVPLLAQQMGKAGRNSIEQEHNWDANVAKLIKKVPQLRALQHTRDN